MDVGTIRQLRADLSAIDQCIDRAGRALGCAFSSSAEFEAAMIRVRRHDRAIGRRLAHMRVLFGAVAAASLAAVLTLAVRVLV